MPSALVVRLGTVAHPHLHLALPAHDRVAHRRDDQAWLEEQWADPASRVLVVAGSRIRPLDGAPSWVSPAHAPDGLRVLLGRRDGRTWFAVVIDPDDAPGERSEWLGLRAVLGHLAESTDGQAPLVFHAIGIAEWLHATRCCPRCGGRLEAKSAGHQLVCAACGKAQFPRTDPAVIMAIAFGEPGADDEQLLLGRQAVWPVDRFSTLAGFCEPGESLEDAVRRETLEETGVVVGEVTYFGNQPWPFPGSMMVGFTGRATTQELVLEDEIEEARWVTRAQMHEQAAAGRLILPGGVSISRSLVEAWYGGPLPGTW